MPSQMGIRLGLAFLNKTLLISLCILVWLGCFVYAEPGQETDVMRMSRRIAVADETYKKFKQIAQSGDVEGLVIDTLKDKVDSELKLTEKAEKKIEEAAAAQGQTFHPSQKGMLSKAIAALMGNPINASANELFSLGAKDYLTAKGSDLAALHCMDTACQDSFKSSWSDWVGNMVDGVSSASGTASVWVNQKELDLKISGMTAKLSDSFNKMAGSVLNSAERVVNTLNQDYGSMISPSYVSSLPVSRAPAQGRVTFDDFSALKAKLNQQASGFTDTDEAAHINMAQVQANLNGYYTKSQKIEEENAEKMEQILAMTTVQLAQVAQEALKRKGQSTSGTMAADALASSVTSPASGEPSFCGRLLSQTGTDLNRLSQDAQKADMRQVALYGAATYCIQGRELSKEKAFGAASQAFKKAEVLVNSAKNITVQGFDPLTIGAFHPHNVQRTGGR